MTMVRSFFAAGICLALAAALSAGEPSAHAGRTSLESLLQTPAELDFGHRQTITVKELLDEIHRKDHISIRFDSPVMEAMSGSAHTDPPATAMTACGDGVASSSWWHWGHQDAISSAPACCMTQPPIASFAALPPAPAACGVPVASAGSAPSAPPAPTAPCAPLPPPASAMTACGNGIAAAWQQVAPGVASASTTYCVPMPPAPLVSPLPPPPPVAHPALSTTGTPNTLHKYLLVVNPLDGSQVCSPPVESTSDYSLVTTFDDVWKKLVEMSSAKTVCAATEGCECGHCCQTTNTVAGNPTCPAKCANSAHKSTPTAGCPAASYPAATVAYPTTSPSVPEPPHAIVQINVTAPQVIPNGGTAEPAPSNVVESPHKATLDLLNTDIYIQNIDMHNVSIATALQIALDALPDGEMGFGSGGLPIAVSNAEKLDFVVENDGILITTRLKALTYKETRVYNVKHLKDLKAEQVAAVIKQSVRPWSWRSRIDDLGEQLRSGGPRIPAKAVAALLKSGVQLASAESPLAELTAGAEATATDAPGDKSAAKPNTASPTTTTGAETASDSDSLSAQDAVQLGDALVNGLVTFVHASITTVEIMHYADPPTGIIQTVPGKLIITQSQAAHREIAELLKELAEE
jgi:hypothetical protein